MLKNRGSFFRQHVGNRGTIGPRRDQPATRGSCRWVARPVFEDLKMASVRHNSGSYLESVGGFSDRKQEAKGGTKVLDKRVNAIAGRWQHIGLVDD